MATLNVNKFLPSEYVMVQVPSLGKLLAIIRSHAERQPIGNGISYTVEFREDDKLKGKLVKAPAFLIYKANTRLLVTWDMIECNAGWRPKELKEF